MPRRNKVLVPLCTISNREAYIKIYPNHPKVWVQPIVFLSRAPTPAEGRYWPTELEVLCVVWVLRKIRRLMEVCSPEMPPVIYTDHTPTVGISKQTSIDGVEVENLNFRLVRASMYIQQFSLRVVHRKGKGNVMADALSRLPQKGERKAANLTSTHWTI